MTPSQRSRVSPFRLAPLAAAIVMVAALSGCGAGSAIGGAIGGVVDVITP